MQLLNFNTIFLGNLLLRKGIYGITNIRLFFTLKNKKVKICSTICRVLKTAYVGARVYFFRGNVCNHNIVPNAARYLGVRTEDERFLDQHREGIPFGQEEPLTTRLNNILRGHGKLNATHM